MIEYGGVDMSTRRTVKSHERAHEPRSGSFQTVVICLCLLSVSASASDGVVEINQACAVQTGCFSGDAAGFPVTIDRSAGTSYRLTSDLVLSDNNTDGIQISGMDIAIDLNDFSITTIGCHRSLDVCTPTSGIGLAIVATGSYYGASVRNGSVVGMGLAGLALPSLSHVIDVSARWNRTDGISVGGGSVVSGCTTFMNGGIGISGGSGSTITGNASHDNGSAGIAVAAGATVTNNSVYQNASNGIQTGAGATISGNSAARNGNDGIQAGAGSTIVNNTAYENGDDGIQASSQCLVQKNSVMKNTGFGLRLFPTAAYRENVITTNTAGTVSGGLNMLSNSCNETTTCP